MSNLSKPLSEKDSTQIFQSSYNDKDSTISVSGFVNSKVGNKVTRSVISGVIDDYSFYDGSTLLYTIRVTYNNSSHDEIDQVERTV